MIRLALAPLLLSGLGGAPPAGVSTAEGRFGRPDQLALLEAKAGWRLLFDGASTAGWTGPGGSAAPAGWEVQDGCLHRAAGAGGLLTAEDFGDFELAFEWKIAPGANSGVRYRLRGLGGPEAPRGPEYQILDGAAGLDAAPAHRAGALYDLAAPADSPPAAAGEFHRARIVAWGNRIEHWLDGVRVVAADLESAEWAEAVAASKFAGVAAFAAPGRSPILLQDHGGEVWYRSLRLRELDALAGEEAVLSTGEGLPGWRALGDAVWTAEDGAILGRAGGGHQSFLVTERSFGDFLLEVDVKNELPGNSGIQVRSHVRENGTLHGYQIEIDPSERAWSGGLYDEGRRGWLQDLAGNDAGRRAFRSGEWNHYRIECVGPWIRAWVNGVPTADCFDPADMEGAIGLQVHSGTDTRVRWRDFRLREFGRNRWEEVPPPPADPRFPRNPFRQVDFERQDHAFRVRYRSETGLLVIEDAPAGWLLHEEPPMPPLDPPLIANGGWAMCFAARDREHLRPGEWNELAVCCFGGRAVVHLNGRRIRDFCYRPRPAAYQAWLRPPRGSAETLEYGAIDRLAW
ncbi:MAG: DUF1080 domain-containing protein [Planctomycetota bacterium]